MAYACSTCGEESPSDGARRLHDLVAHLSPADDVPSAAPAPVPPSPPPPGPPLGTARAPGRALAVLAVAVCASLVAGVAGALHVRSSTSSSPAAEEVAAPLDRVASPASDATPLRTVGRSDEGFAIGVPDGLTEVPLSPEVLAEMAQSAESLNPAVAGLLESAGGVFETIRLFALDPVSGRALLVQKVEAERGTEIGDLPRGTLSAQYRQMGAVSTDEARVRIPAGDAVLVTASFAMDGTTVPVTQYVLAHGGFVWILTSTAPDGSDDAAAIADTFRFL